MNKTVKELQLHFQLHEGAPTAPS
ncbi:Protein of unknown function [Bacillus cytotoxicus]|nr:Protein of unknown function [Bacillus cytotoxicus]